MKRTAAGILAVLTVAAMIGCMSTDGGQPNDKIGATERLNGDSANGGSVVDSSGEGGSPHWATTAGVGGGTATSGLPGGDTGRGIAGSGMGSDETSPGPGANMGNMPGAGTTPGMGGSSADP